MAREWEREREREREREKELVFEVDTGEGKMLHGLRICFFLDNYVVAMMMDGMNG